MGHSRETEEVRRPKVAFVTVSAPWGVGNGFELGEMAILREHGFRVLLVPRSPTGPLLDGNPEDFGEDLLALPLFHPRYLLSVLSATARRETGRRVAKALWLVLVASGRGNLLRNLAVFPKAVHLAREFERRRVDHIHAAWANTPATIGFVIHALTGIPWSMTGHRGDIKVANLLAAKGATASFVRASTEKGVAAFERAGVPAEKLALIRMGTDTHRPLRRSGRGQPPVILTVANLIPVKALGDLLSACRELALRGVAFRAWIVGQGFLRRELESLAASRGLADRVTFLGPLGHCDVLRLYRHPQVRVAALTSKRTADGSEEGVPVTLLEAMAAGLPVVATDCGSTSELLPPASNLLVPAGDVKAIADAIQQILDDPEHARRVAIWCRARVVEAFDQRAETAKLARLVRMHLRGAPGQLPEREVTISGSP